MDKEQGIEFLLTSPLGRYLKRESVTDVSYNGRDVFYVDNNTGRVKAEINFPQDSARDFIRQIANICEKQFSFSSPRLDVTLGNYRVNAMHQCIGRNKGEVVTFAIRIASEKIRIFEDRDFLCDEVKELLDVLIASHQSIVIGGLPGAGKTELQKYLLTRPSNDQRVIVVDNILELENIRNYINYDLTIWQYNENNQNASLPLLIKESLRNMPDWVILAEGRGEEMRDILNSAVTGLPIITTIHSFDANSIPVRMARLVMQSEKNCKYEEILEDIKYHFRYYVYLRREKDISGYIKRYISSIVHLDSKGKAKEIYYDDLAKRKTSTIDHESLAMLKFDKRQRVFIKAFVGGSYE